MTVETGVVGRLGRAALDLVFPPRCASCGGGGAFLCERCRSALPVAGEPRCPRCWAPRRMEGVCLACRQSPPAFDSLFTAFVYAGPAREAVHALKYRGMTAVAPEMAGLLAGALRGRGSGSTIIVPVPLSGVRRRTRGYNQAGVLARALGAELGLPVRPEALVRRRHAPPQARSADAAARRRNVAGAFRARAGAVEGERVLLLDDVTTTGATLGACAAALREAGARSIQAVAFARED